MWNSIKEMLGFGPDVNFAGLVKDGALILDVRSKGEFDSGHIPGAQHIPLDKLGNNLHQLRKDRTIITCCASGMRSATARSILNANGFNEVYNGGGWRDLQQKIS